MSRFHVERSEATWMGTIASALLGIILGFVVLLAANEAKLPLHANALEWVLLASGCFGSSTYLFTWWCIEND